MELCFSVWGMLPSKMCGYHEGRGIEPLLQSATDASHASGWLLFIIISPLVPQTILFLHPQGTPSVCLFLELLIGRRQQNWKSIHAVWPFCREWEGTGTPPSTFSGSFTPWSLALNQRD